MEPALALGKGGRGIWGWRLASGRVMAGFGGSLRQVGETSRSAFTDAGHEEEERHERGDAERELDPG